MLLKTKSIILTSSIWYALTLTACSNINVSSNAGQYGALRAKSLAVKEYSQDDLFRLNAYSLGIIEASYCQKDRNQATPSERSLINNLKVQAYNLGANGIIVANCQSDSYDMCHSDMTCSAEAFSIRDQ